MKETQEDKRESKSRNRLIVLSNTLPIILERSSRTNRWKVRKTLGGFDKFLCLSGVREEMPFLWMGYVGREVEEEERESVKSLLWKYQCVPIFLKEEEAKSHLEGYSSSVLWSCFHYVPEPMSNYGLTTETKNNDLQIWQDYQNVNSIFANEVCNLYQVGDRVWIHDHHLMLVPSFLRALVKECHIGWFLHTPFPSSDVYLRLAKRKELLEGLLCSDVVGFQTYDYARHFLSVCRFILNVDCGPNGVKVNSGHFTSLGVFPIGMNVNHFEKNMNQEKTKDRISILKQKFKGKKILLGIDRLDYMKGVPHKLLAMERLLSRYPEWRNQLVLVQIGIATSKCDITAQTANHEENLPNNYKQWLIEINQLVGRINGAYGTLDYNPIHFINQRYMEADELCALYSIADVCVVTSTRDGMNLVSHEYTVCQNCYFDNSQKADDYDGPGTLVVSEFAGCAQSLSGALLINPWHTESVASSLHQALTMTKVERELRHQKCYRYVASNTAAKWANNFVKCLDNGRKRNKTKKIDATPRLIPKDTLEAYRNAKNRVIIADYDGTITPIQSLPHLAAPSSFLKPILNALGEDVKNTVYIVSNRKRKFLEEWLADVNVGLAAEDGLFYRMHPKDKWKTMSKYLEDATGESSKWKDIVIPIMQSFTERTPGSCIESTEITVSWNYHDSDYHFGSWQAKDLQTTLERIVSGTALEIVMKDKIVEVKHEGCSKATILENVLKYLSLPEQVAIQDGPVDFVLGVGNASNEAMFQSLNFLHKEATSLSMQKPKDDTASCNEDNASDVDVRQTSIDHSLSTVEYEPVRMHENANVFAVHVGEPQGSTHATSTLPSVSLLRRLLKGFAEISSTP